MASGLTLKSLNIGEEDAGDRQLVHIGQCLLDSSKFSAPLTRLELHGKGSELTPGMIDVIQGHMTRGTQLKTSIYEPDRY